VTERPVWLLTVIFDSIITCYRPFILIASFCVLSSLIIKKTKICDAAHEKVPNCRNGVISMVVHRTYEGIKQNKNHSKIPSKLTFRDIEFQLEKL